MSQRYEARPWLSTMRVLFKPSGAVPLLLAMLASIGAPVLAADTTDIAGRAAVDLSIGTTGASLLDPFTLSTGIPIQNGGTATAENVEITSIALRGFMGGATLTSPTLPFNLGSVTTSASEGGMTPLFARFASPNASLVPGGEYVLIITGTYDHGGAPHPFVLVQVLAIPEAAPGSAQSDTATVEQGSPGGSPGDQASSNEEDVNEEAYVTPVGLFVPVTSSDSIQVVIRVALDDLSARANPLPLRWVNPKFGGTAIGSHLAQTPGDTAFWAGHKDTSTLRIFHWPDGSSEFFWRDRTTQSYLNTNYSSTTPAPNPQDWMTKMNSGTRDHILGATRSGNDLWFAWTAAANPPAFPQPYVALVDLDIASDFKVNHQSQIWTPDRSFAYPALATNAATGEIGFSLETGGPGFYENHAVGFVGGQIFITTDSVAGTTRYGDYTTIRQDPQPTLFDAFGYQVLTSPGGSPPNQASVHYVVFGRPGS